MTAKIILTLTAYDCRFDEQTKVAFMPLQRAHKNVSVPMSAIQNFLSCGEKALGELQTTCAHVEAFDGTWVS